MYQKPVNPDQQPISTQIFKKYFGNVSKVNFGDPKVKDFLNELNEALKREEEKKKNRYLQT